MMELIIRPDGTVQCVYGEEVDLHPLGQLQIHRASHVEPDEQGQWWVDLSPVGGPMLGPYPGRCLALADENRWLRQSVHLSPKEGNSS